MTQDSSKITLRNCYRQCRKEGAHPIGAIFVGFTIYLVFKSAEIDKPGAMGTCAHCGNDNFAYPATSRRICRECYVGGARIER